MLKQNADKDGYLSVMFVARPLMIRVKSHRLVAQHFLPPSDLPEVNHIDLNKARNIFSNLEWTTPKGNSEHARRAGVFNAALNPNRVTKLTVEQIPKIIAAREAKRTYADIGSEFGITCSTVRKIVLGEYWQSTPKALSRRDAASSISTP